MWRKQSNFDQTSATSSLIRQILAVLKYQNKIPIIINVSFTIQIESDRSLHFKFYVLLTTIINLQQKKLMQRES